MSESTQQNFLKGEHSTKIKKKIKKTYEWEHSTKSDILPSKSFVECSHSYVFFIFKGITKKVTTLDPKFPEMILSGIIHSMAPTLGLILVSELFCLVYLNKNRLWCSILADYFHFLLLYVPLDFVVLFYKISSFSCFYTFHFSCI